MLPTARINLLAYAIAFMPSYQVGEHHRKIARALERVVTGECKRLMIFAPPRHGKTALVAQLFPSWFFGHFPDNKVIYSTYAQDLALDSGRMVRNYMADPLYQKIFPGVGLASDSSAMDAFNTNQGGDYFAVGIGSATTGRGADVFIIDDPTKDHEDANSDTIKRRNRNWYSSVVTTRLMPDAAIIVIQTRWTEDDLSGWLLDEAKAGGDQWEVISLPAIREEPMLVNGRKVFDENHEPMMHEVALWPEWFSLEELHKKKRVMTPSHWEALYQQRPRPETGGVFKKNWIQFYAGSLGRAEGMNKYLLIDPANERRKADADNDYTSMWVVGLNHDENIYVLDMVRDRLSLTQRTSEVFRLHRKWRPVETRYEQYGLQSDIAHIRDEMNRQKYRFKITEVSGKTPKPDRIKRLVPYFEKERVWFPGSFWYTDVTGVLVDLVEAFINQEYLAFPVGRHDDMLDALARIEQPEKELALKWPKPPRATETGPGYGVLDREAGF